MGVLGIFMSVSDAPSAVRSTLAGRFDPAVCDYAWHNTATGGNGTTYQFHHAEAAGDITWYHFAIRFDAQDTNDLGLFHTILDATGKEICQFDAVSAEWQLDCFGTTTVSSENQTYPITLTRWDLKIDLTGSSLVVTLYSEGGVTPLLEVTVPTSNTGNPSQIHLRLNDMDDIYTSELYVADFDTRGTRPVKQVPDAVGNDADWVGSFSDLGDEDVITGANTGAGGNKLTVNIGAFPGAASPGGVKEVVIKNVCAKGSTGPSNIRNIARIGATDYFSANLDPEVSVPIPKFSSFANNPDTSAPWGTTDLDTTEFGIEAVT